MVQRYSAAGYLAKHCYGLWHFSALAFSAPDMVQRYTVGLAKTRYHLGQFAAHAGGMVQRYVDGLAKHSYGLW